MTQRKVRTTPDRNLQNAFQDYMTERPWVPLKDHHVLALTHPADGTPFYVIAMGDAGQEYGISLHMGENGFQDMGENGFQDMGENGFQDMAAIVTGHQENNALAPMIAAMAEYPPDQPLGQHPVIVYYRVDPAHSMAASITNIFVNTLPKVTISDKIALAHAFHAATNLARTAGNPESPVKPRNHPSSLHMITATLKGDNWHYELETGGLQIRD